MISYRLAAHEDLNQLSDLHIAAYSEFEKSLPLDGWTLLNASLQNKNKLIDVFTNARAFVEETSGHIVGMAFLVKSGNPTTIYPADWSYIRMVGMDLRFRGNGIGKRLTNMCIEEARKNGEKIIGLHTSEVMDSARHL